MEIEHPYQNTISNLLELQWIQCPITKLNHIYQVLKFDLAEEIDHFYSKVEMKVSQVEEKLLQESSGDKADKIKAEIAKVNKKHLKDRVMDIDNLQSVSIYIVNQMRYPLLISEYFLINDFVSKNVGISARSIFLNCIKSAVDYILEQIQNNNPLKDKKIQSTLIDREQVDPKMAQTEIILSNRNPQQEEAKVAEVEGEGSSLVVPRITGPSNP